MSYDLAVEGGNAIDLAVWAASLRSLRIVCDFHPEFVPAAAFGGVVPVRLEVLDPALFRGADKLHAAGKIAAWFEFGMPVVTDETPRVDLEMRERVWAESIARLEEVAAPAFLIDRQREELAHTQAQLRGVRSDQPPDAWFSIKGSAPNYVAGIYSAVAFAHCTRGSLRQGGKTWSGDAILDAASAMLDSAGLDDGDFDVHDAFVSWDD